MELIRQETGLGLIDREWVGRGKYIVNSWTVVWEKEVTGIAWGNGSRYWFGLLKDKDGEEAYRILELDIRGINHHIKIAKGEMFDFMVALSLWMKDMERMNDGQPGGWKL